MKPKAAPTSATIDDYIAGFPRPVQRLLQQVRATIRKAAPDASEAIKYRIPTFVLHGNLIHFAAFQAHVGLYPAPYDVPQFAAAMARYGSGKATLRFPFDEPLPLALIRRIVAFRVAERRRKLAARAASARRTRVPRR